MTDKAQETHEGEEGLAREQTGPKCPVEVEGGERLGRSRQAETHVAALGADSHEGIEKRKRASHVLLRRERLDVANFDEQRIQLRRADLPLDPRRRTHQVAPLAVRLDPPGRPVLPEPAPEVSGLADIEEDAGRVVEMVDTRDQGDPGEEVSAKLQVEEVHRSLRTDGPRRPQSGVAQTGEALEHRIARAGCQNKQRPGRTVIAGGDVASVARCPPAWIRALHLSDQVHAFRDRQSNDSRFERSRPCPRGCSPPFSRCWTMGISMSHERR